MGSFPPEAQVHYAVTAADSISLIPRTATAGHVSEIYMPVIYISYCVMLSDRGASRKVTCPELIWRPL